MYNHMSNECTNFANLTEEFKLHNEVVEHFLISTCFLQLQKEINKIKCKFIET